MTTRLNAAIWAAVLLLTSTAAFATTLDNVKKRGFVQCGVGKKDAPGFSSVDANGNWKGIDADICRAVAAAVFGDPAKVKFRQLLAEERFTALRFGTIDMLLDKSTWTMQRDTTYDISFAGVTYHDGQGFLARKKLGVSSALELSGASVCSQSGASREKDAAQFFRSRKLPFDPILFDDAQSATAAYDAGQCDVLTDDVSRLYAIRLTLAKPADHMVLPEIVSKEPLGPFVRRDDDQWFSLVKWTLFALINAEELGIS
ncbi:MAG: amino acid ABC transporter substrate-binding protein, partial [Hyphomicrobiales bacterium]|nr:amino acid ABC transporter substrate-binding protein [Hyphomicrobiales bacterium]